MESARQELAAAIEDADFKTPICPVYQNVDAAPHTSPEEIKANLIAQLTAPVRWTQIVEHMTSDGITEYVELGPGTVLQGLISKISPDVKVESVSTF
jgi:[acyl-carrier-protein] S-malonyltransferase